MLLATDELSMDVGSIAQLLIFLQEVTETFQISEEYSATVSLKDETGGCGLYDAVSYAIDKSNLQWSQLLGVTTDSVPSMKGKEMHRVAMLKKTLMENSEI